MIRAVLAPVAIRPEFLAIPGNECQDDAADGDGNQDRCFVPVRRAPC